MSPDLWKPAFMTFKTFYVILFEKHQKNKKGGVPPYMEFTQGSAHAQNFIKFCIKIVYYMCVLFVRYLPFHLYFSC